MLLLAWGKGDGAVASPPEGEDPAAEPPAEGVPAPLFGADAEAATQALAPGYGKSPGEEGTVPVGQAATQEYGAIPVLL